MDFPDAAVAFHGHVERPALVRLQLERIGCHAGGEPRRPGLEQQRRAPHVAITAQIIQHNPGVTVDFRGRGAAAFAAQPPHLEQIGEIAREGKR